MSPVGERRKVQCWRGVPIVPSVPIKMGKVSTAQREGREPAGDPTGASVGTCATGQYLPRRSHPVTSRSPLAACTRTGRSVPGFHQQDDYRCQCAGVAASDQSSGLAFVVFLDRELLSVSCPGVSVLCRWCEVGLVSVSVRPERLSAAGITRDAGHHSRLVPSSCCWPPRHAALASMTLAAASRFIELSHSPRLWGAPGGAMADMARGERAGADRVARSAVLTRVELVE